MPPPSRFSGDHVHSSAPRFASPHQKPSVVPRTPRPWLVLCGDAAPSRLTASTDITVICNRADPREGTRPHASCPARHHPARGVLPTPPEGNKWRLYLLQAPNAPDLQPAPLQPYLVLSSGGCFLTRCPQEITCSAESSAGTGCPSLHKEPPFPSEPPFLSGRRAPKAGSSEFPPFPPAGPQLDEGVTVHKQIQGFPALLRIKQKPLSH